MCHFSPELTCSVLPWSKDAATKEKSNARKDCHQRETKHSMAASSANSFTLYLFLAVIEISGEQSLWHFWCQVESAVLSRAKKCPTRVPGCPRCSIVEHGGTKNVFHKNGDIVRRCVTVSFALNRCLYFRFDNGCQKYCKTSNLFLLAIHVSKNNSSIHCRNVCQSKCPQQY